MLYIVWNDRLWSSYFYHSLSEARKAKKKLIKDNPDVRFIIMQSIKGEYDEKVNCSNDALVCNKRVRV